MKPFRQMKRTLAGVEDLMPVVSVARWGRDHWTTLLYLESRCVDYGGKIDNQHMRTNARLHRGVLGEAQKRGGITSENCPTRLRSGRPLHHHDDWSCVEDMVGHGLVEVLGERDHTPSQPFGGIEVRVKLSSLGWLVAHQIRRDRAEGTPTATWQPKPELEAEIHAGFVLEKSR